MSDYDLVRSWKNLDETDLPAANPAGEIDLTTLSGGLEAVSEWAFTWGCCNGQGTVGTW